MPARSSEFWHDVCAVGIEDPRGHNAGAIYRVQGAILSCLPAHLLVHPLVPSAWRKLVGLAGNASKSEVQLWAWNQILGETAAAVPKGSVYRLGIWDDAWPSDACDAYCIALATRALITTPKEKAA